MMASVPHIAAMVAYALADLGGPDTTSLAQNESTFPASPKAIGAGQGALAKAHLYPDPGWSELRSVIADVHGLNADGLLCGAGSMELIGCLIRAFAGPDDEVLGSAYGYLFVATAAAQAPAHYVKAAEDCLMASVDNILAAVTARTRIVFVCNPGNPTGTCLPNTEVLRLRGLLPDGVLLVVDQAYGEFDMQDPRPVFKLAESGNTVVLRTFSKAYGLAGARVGWGLFPMAIVSEVRKLLNPNSISVISQAMAVAAMRDQPHMREIVTRTADLRHRFSEGLRANGYTVPRSHTNFVLIRFADADEARAADVCLRAAGLMMRGMTGYGLADCLRATIGSEQAMARALDTLIHFRQTRDDS